MTSKSKEHNTYRQGGREKSDQPDKLPAATDAPAQPKSWTPDRKGQGGEGLSKGYGGSGGKGTGQSGPDDTSEPDPLDPGNIPGQNPATPERPPGHTNIRRNKR